MNDSVAEFSLSPSQQRSFDFFVDALPIGNCFLLSGGTGKGKSTLLNALHRKYGGTLVTSSEFFERLRTQNPHALEETLLDLILDALSKSEFVFWDDADACNGTFRHHFYPRYHFSDSAFEVIARSAIDN